MILWLALLLLQLPSQGQPRDASPSGSVRGRVLDSGTGAPVAGAILQIHAPGGQPLKRVETSANGDFQLADLPRGAWLTVTPPPLQATHIPRLVQPDLSTRSEVVIHLDPALAVEGRVVNEYDGGRAGGCRTARTSRGRRHSSRLAPACHRRSRTVPVVRPRGRKVSRVRGSGAAWWCIDVWEGVPPR